MPGRNHRATEFLNKTKRWLKLSFMIKCNVYFAVAKSKIKIMIVTTKCVINQSGSWNHSVKFNSKAKYPCQHKSNSKNFAFKSPFYSLEKKTGTPEISWLNLPHFKYSLLGLRLKLPLWQRTLHWMDPINIRSIWLEGL